MSTIILKDFLQNALTPVDRYPIVKEKPPQYGWIYVKENKSVRYLEIGSEDSKGSLEKILLVMKKQLKGTNPINYAEKNQLRALSAMITHHTGLYKEAHKGCIGRSILYFRGVYHGGHIDKVSSKLQKKIEELLSVDTGTTPMKERQIENQKKCNQMSQLKTELDDFLKKGSISIDKDAEDNYRWAYCKSKKVIKYCDLSEEVEAPGIDQYAPCKLEKVFSLMKREIKHYKKVDLVDASQKLQLVKLRERVVKHQEDYKKQNSGCLSAFSNLRERMRYGEVHRLAKHIVRDIDFLLHEVNIPPAPTLEMREIMQSKADNVIQEILTTEETFINCLDDSINAIDQLIKISLGNHKCGHENESFFRGSGNISLAACKHAFQDVKEKAEVLLQAFRDTEEGKLTHHEVAEIYSGEAFIAYSIAMRLAVRYYQGPLMALIRGAWVKK